MEVKVAQVCLTLCDPMWTIQSMEFSRPEYWTGSPGNLPNPGIKPRSPALQVDSLPPEPQGKPILKEINPEYSSEGLMQKLKL